MSESRYSGVDLEPPRRRWCAGLAHVVAFVFSTILLAITAAGCADETEPLGPEIAALEVSPDAGEFPDTVVRARSVLFVELRNESDGDLELAGLPSVVEDEAGSAFSAGEVLLDCDDPGSGEEAESLVVPPGDCRAFAVTFSPLETGSFEGELRIESNAEGGYEGGVHLVGLIGTAVSPRIELCLPPSDCAKEEVCWSSLGDERPLLAFDMIDIGESRACPVRVNNLGGGLLKVAGWGFTEGNRFGDFALDPAQMWDLEVEPGESVELKVFFGPVSGGVREGTIAISTNDPEDAHIWIDVSGVGDGPRVCVDPIPVLDLGRVEVGGKVQGKVTLESCGTKALDVTEVWMADSRGRDESEVFSMSEGAPIPAYLEPGEELSIPVEFSPLEPGGFQGRFYFETNDRIVKKGYVTLTAEGLPRPACELVVDGGDQLSFGIAMAGETISRRLPVSNRGEIACSDVVGAITGGEKDSFEHSSNDQPFDVQPGERVLFDLWYAPTNADGPHEAVLTITSPDADDMEVNLWGDASEEPACNLAVTPPRTGKHMPEHAGVDVRRWLDFEHVAMGDARTLSAMLKNVGSADCTVNEIRLWDLYPFVAVEGFETTASGGKVLVNGEQTRVIRPGEVGELKLRFTPESSHLHRGRLVISTDDPAWADEYGDPGTYEVALTGKGVRARAAAVPASVDFGSVTGGCASTIREVNVWATGDMPVTLEEPVLEGDGSFEVIDAPVAGETIPPGEKVTYEIRFRPPEGSGTNQATLKVGTSAGGGEVMVNLEGRRTEETFRRDEYRVRTQKKIDVLLVIDDSPRMAGFATHLRENLEEFMRRTTARAADTRLGVITTDWSDPDKSGKLQGDPLVVTLEHPDPVQAVLDNADVGAGGHHAERSFEMAVRALSEPLASDHNAGFRREGAVPQVVFVSAGIEQSEGPVAYYADFLRSLTNLRYPLSVWVAAGDPDVGCATEDGTALPGDRYFELTATGRPWSHQGQSFCDSWGMMPDSIGLDAWSPPASHRIFFLSHEPLVGTVHVLVDDRLVPKGGSWEYDAALNAIVFSTYVAPEYGATIEISYEALCRSH